MHALLLLTCPALLLLSGCATRPASRPAPHPIEQRTVVYKTIDGTALHLHLFEPAEEDHLRTTDRRAAVVFFFGGGWVRGTPEQFFPHAEYLASRGLLAVSAEYRVRDRHGTTPFEAVADGKSAVRWLRTHADALGIDPDRIAAGGGSAGGHVAASTAFVDAPGTTDEAATVSAVPNALILFNPVIDTSERGFGADRIGARTLDLSPTHHVTPDAPPTIIFHGTADTTVPFENVERFCREMHARDNRCELVPFEGAGHGFFNYGRNENAAFTATVRAMDRFLASLGYLSGPPRLY